MEDHSRSPRAYIAQQLAQMKGIVNVEERYMLPLHLNMDDVPTAKSDASDADDRPEDSGPAIHAESDVVRECRLCKHKRLDQGISARKVQRLPSDVTQHALFKNKSIPVQLCPECDGEAVKLALQAHADRQQANV